MVKVNRERPTWLARAWAWLVFAGVVMLLLFVPMIKAAARFTAIIARAAPIVLGLGAALIWLGMRGRRKRHEEQ